MALAFDDQPLRSRTQTMPFVLPLAETDGVAPRGGGWVLETGECGVAILALQNLNRVDGQFCPRVLMYPLHDARPAVMPPAHCAVLRGWAGGASLAGWFYV